MLNYCFYLQQNDTGMTAKNYGLLSLLLLLFAAALYFMRNTPLQVDEKDYYPQIIRFASGDYTVDPNISALPTYHALQACISKITGITDVVFFRFINVLFALMAIAMFLRTDKALSNDDSLLKTLQFTFLPFIFPYFLLIYTDVLSMMLMLTAFYFFVKKNYQWCGIFSIMGCMVRQNNIMWLGMFLVLSYLEISQGGVGIKGFVAYLKKYWSFAAGVLLFIIFVALNKGIAVGDKSMHPPFSIQLGNVYFFLFLHFILFLPLHLSNAKNIFHFISKYKIVLLGVALFYVVFMFTFHNTHPYNTQWGNYFLRNRLLILFSCTNVHKIIFFLPVCYAVLSLCVTPLKSKYFWLMYATAFLFLIPSWLIEQRYYMIPFAFFLLMKKEDKKWMEVVTLGVFVLMSAFFYLMIRSNTHFI